MKLLFWLLSSKSVSNCPNKFKVICVFIFEINAECFHESLFWEKLVIGSDVINKDYNGWCSLCSDGLFKLGNKVIAVLATCLEEFLKSLLISVNNLFFIRRLIDMMYDI